MLQSYIKPNIKARDFSYKSVGFTLQVLSIFPIKHQDKQTDSGRNLIGRRTQSDRAADGVRCKKPKKRQINLIILHNKTTMYKKLARMNYSV